MSKLRIAMISRRFWPLVGGGEIVVSNLASQFQSWGHEVQIVTAQWEPHWPLELLHRDVRITRIAQPKTRAWGTWRYISGLSNWLRDHRNEFDVVFVSMLKHDAYAAIKTRHLHGKPVVLRAEGGGISGDCHWHQTARFGSRIRKTTLNGSGFIAPSESIRNEMLEAGYPTEKVRLISNGVALFPDRSIEVQGDARMCLAEANRSLLLEPQAPLAVYTGRFHARKGLLDLINAWPYVLKSHPSAQLWLVGEGDYGDVLWERVQELSLKYSVRFPGAFDDLTDILTAADAFVLPSYEEGMSMALLEAMSARVPVVATDIPGNRKLIEHRVNGLLVPTQDPKSIAAALLEVFNKPSEAIARSSAARVLVEQSYSLEKMAAAHLEFFEACRLG